MTAPTPEQMRALADAPDVNHWSASARAALRSAADQLEEDQRVIDGIKACWKVDMLALEAMRGAE